MDNEERSQAFPLISIRVPIILISFGLFETHYVSLQLTIIFTYDLPTVLSINQLIVSNSEKSLLEFPTA